MARKVWTATAAVATVLAAVGAAQAQTGSQPPARVVLPSEAVPEHYDLDVTPDAAHLTFKGSVGIDLKVTKATRRLVLNAADLAIDKVRLDRLAETPEIKVDAEAQTVSFTFKSPIKPGRHRLNVDYHGAISTSSSGFFAVDYDSTEGKKRLIATKFEPAAARRFLPCFDEPGRKATFTVTATVPAEQTPLSNTPIAKSEPLPGGLKRVRFAPSPKMSSYLLFFGTGDFERIHTMVDGVDVGVVVRKGAAEKGRFALDSAAGLLKLYDDYFGVRYPLPKLDLIASPGAGSFGAMENWGAIFYFEPSMLVDPKTSTDADRQRVYGTVAHEMAHQWFGDLVTMDWWDDLWLNEGFATWMAAKATSKLHPEWKPWLQESAGREIAMRLDALPVTHPVVQHVADATQANQAFDSITYQKGEAVIRMVEAYVGEDAFREGVRRYMKRHAYGNTVTDDLWTEVEAAAGQPMRAVAHDFTDQSGVPLIRVESAPDGSVRLGQGRFSFDPAARAGTWRAPLVLKSLASGGEARLLAGDGTVAKVPGGAPVVANAGQSGYARVLYAPADFAALAGRFASLDAADQLGLISDAWALGQAGDAPAARVLELTSRLPADAEPVVWTRTLDTLADIDRLYDRLPGQAAFRSWARMALQPLYQRIGFDPKPGESDNTGVLRERLLMSLSQFDDTGVAAEARKRFLALVDGTEPPAGVRLPVIRIAARHADAATFARLRASARAAVDPLEKRQLDEAMAYVRDPALADAVLQLALTDEVPGPTRPLVIRRVGVENPDLAWAFAVKSLPTVSANLDLRQRTRYLPDVAQTSIDPARADVLHAWAAAELPTGARRFADQSEADIRLRARIRASRLSELDQWLAAHAGGR